MIKIHVPFFGGLSSAAYSDKDKRIDYLFRNISSFYTDIRAKFKTNIQITLHVCQESDERLMKELFPAITLINHNTENPIFLASDCLKWMKENVSDSDIILYSEADQAYKFKSLSEIIRALNDKVYIIPHRIEEIPAANPRCHHPNNLEVLNVEDRLYLVQNRRDFNGGPYEEDSLFYKPSTFDLAFGGSFLILGAALKRVSISYSPILPVEHASGIDAFNSLLALKTVKISDFYCIHYSGYERNLTGQYSLKLNEKS